MNTDPWTMSDQYAGDTAAMSAEQALKDREKRATDAQQAVLSSISLIEQALDIARMASYEYGDASYLADRATRVPGLEAIEASVRSKFSEEAGDRQRARVIVWLEGALATIRG